MQKVFLRQFFKKEGDKKLIKMDVDLARVLGHEALGICFSQRCRVRR